VSEIGVKQQNLINSFFHSPPAQPKRTKRDRSPAQIAAFEKAQAKLREKRAAVKQQDRSIRRIAPAVKH
jgi:hypothetical protein